MKTLSISQLLLLLISSFYLTAHGASFTGNWYIDLSSKEEKENHLECGHAYFDLKQLSNNEIVGTHTFSTIGCGRVNENGPIKGFANGHSAILIVTSGRNGAQVKGEAVLKNGFLYWQVIEEITLGDPAGDGLIFYKGKFKKFKNFLGRKSEF